MADDKAAFGVFPQMKPRRSRQDPEAAKNVPVDLARGFVAGTLGMPADILNLPGALTTAITGKPTYEIPFGSEDIERRLPFRSDTPVSRAATGAGQLAGGFYTGPLSGARAAMAIPKAVVQAGKDFVMAAPQGAPRMFIGPKAKTWDQAKADEAARMEKAGVDPVDIWRQTGTFRGADGIQRQEISDRSAQFLSADERQERIAAIKSKIAEMQEKIKPTPQKDLFPKALTEAKREARDDISILKGDVKGRQKNPRTQGLLAQHIFEHPELYKAYPELQNVNIVTQGGGGNTLGALNILPSRGFYPGSMEMDIYSRALMTDPKSTALHEMQHAVQTLEGMSPGGNITMAFQDPKAFEILNRIRQDYSKPMSLEDFKTQRYGNAIANPERLAAAYQEYLDSISVTKITPQLERLFQEEAAREYYKRLAGEAEARATQFRRDMTPQQRAEEYPYSSYDVPEESLITKPPKEWTGSSSIDLEQIRAGGIEVPQGGFTPEQKSQLRPLYNQGLIRVEEKDGKKIVVPGRGAWYEFATPQQQSFLDAMPKSQGVGDLSLMAPTESVLNSAQASFYDFEIVPGVRNIPIKALEPFLPGYDSPQEMKRIKTLADQIKESKQIEPLFIGIDPTGSAYIMEGQHRIRALKELGYNEVPAKVVVDMDDVTKAAGGEVKMAEGGEVGGGAAFGVFPQMKPRRGAQDREASKNVPIDLARGFVAGTLGMPGDIESLVRLPYELVTGKESPTILPTSSDIEKRLPLKSDTPVSRAATGAGQLAGGFYTGPLSGARAVTAVPKALVRAGRDFIEAAGQPAVNVVKPKGGNWLTDRVGRELQYLKSPTVAGETPAQRIPRHQALLEDPSVPPESRATVERHLDEEIKRNAVDQWVDRNLSNYIKNQMATPEDPVRLMLDRRTEEIEAKFAKDMERANKVAERAAAETDPRRAGNLTREADRLKMEAQADRDLSMSHILPNQQELVGTANRAAGEARLSRAIEGFPEEGMARTPAGKTWENITDSEMGVSANRAGDAQAAVEKAQKTEDLLAKLRAKEQEIENIFEENLGARGTFSVAEIQALKKAMPTREKLNILNDADLADEYENLSKAAGNTRQSYKEKDLKIAEQYPWVEKLDPETRLYEFYGSHDLGFSHIIDVLKQDLAAGRITPEQLNRMSMDQAVRRAADYDRELAAKMNATRAAAREGLPVYKEYPEGYRWVELNKPGAFAAESEAMGHSVRGYEPPKGHPDWSPGSGEEGSSGYGFGGWEGIKSGRAKIYSLVDPKGEPHVTVEVRGLGDIAKKRIQEQYTTSGQKVYVVGANDAGEGGEVFTDLADAIKHEAEFIEKHQKHLRPEITQIRGKQNTPPKEEYLPYVQDLVKSGDWSNVEDLQNTGLFKVTQGQRLPGFSKEIPPGYYSIEDFKKMAAENEMPKEILDTWISKLQERSRYGYKRGGRVSISDNPDAMMMDVMDKKMAEGGGVYDTDPDMSDGGKIIQGPAFQVGGIVKRVAKAVAREEPSLPLTLPRAPAKTKEEIRPIAQRMAGQMTGDFVRPNPKKSINPAGKSLKQFEMEQQLTHDIRPTEGVTLLPQEVADIEKQKGMLKIGVSGDTTIADKTLYRAGPYELDLPSPQHGGPLFGLGGEGAWASNNPVAATFQKRVQELSQANKDAPVLGQYMAMGPQGSNFALHFADANLRAIDLSKMNGRQIEQVNNLIRQGSEKSGPRPSFPGIEDKDSAYLHFAFDPELRKHFNAIMQSPETTQSLNLPDGRVILHAISEPEVRNMEILTSGLSQFRLDPSIDPANLALSAHPTYSHVIPKVPGTEITRTKYPTPAELEFPDVAEFIKQNYRPRDATRVYQTATPRQMVDPQHIDEIKMFEELMKDYTGKKEGGEVEMAGGGAIKAGLKEMMERIANRFGGFEAQRLERAADEVPNLEKLYQAEALEKLFGGDNAKGIMTMNPADFEKFSTKLPFDPKSKKEFVFEPDFAKNLPPNMTQEEYIRYLANLPGFSDIPFLEINTTPFGQKPAPFISGHEGRHRSRALAESGQPTSIVQVFPRANLRESMPRRTREEYLNALNEELEMTNRMVRPQKTERTEKPRSLIKLPPVYKEGGEINMAGGGSLSKAAAEAMAKFKQLRGEFAERAAEAAKYEKETANIPTRDLMSFEEWKASQKRSESQPLPKETGNKSGGLIKVQKKRKAKA